MPCNKLGTYNSTTATTAPPEPDTELSRREKLQDSLKKTQLTYLVPTCRKLHILPKPAYALNEYSLNLETNKPSSRPRLLCARS